jgi:hypothetical protein
MSLCFSFFTVDGMEGSVTTTPNVTGLAGDGLITEGVPVPERLEVCGLLAPESETLNVAVREPGAVGVNVTKIEQLALFASVVPHEVVLLKSPALAPVNEIATLVMVTPLLFVSVKVTGLSLLLFPTVVAAKV